MHVHIFWVNSLNFAGKIHVFFWWNVWNSTFGEWTPHCRWNPCFFFWWNVWNPTFWWVNSPLSVKSMFFFLVKCVKSHILVSELLMFVGLSLFFVKCVKFHIWWVNSPFLSVKSMIFWIGSRRWRQRRPGAGQSADRHRGARGHWCGEVGRRWW